MSHNSAASQSQTIWNAMIDGRPHTIAALAKRTGFPPQSVASRIRDFRTEEFGGHTVIRRPTRVRNVFSYVLVENQEG